MLFVFFYLRTYNSFSYNFSVFINKYCCRNVASVAEHVQRYVLLAAPTIDESAKKCKKCDFCYDLIKNGKNPACVDVCNARALDFGELDDLKAKYAGAKSVGGETKASTLIIKKSFHLCKDFLQSVL